MGQCAALARALARALESGRWARARAVWVELCAGMDALGKIR